MKIIDNFLNQEELINLQNLYTSNEFPWCYQTGVDSIDTKRNDFFFCHMLYNHNVPKSNYFNSIAPIFSKLDDFKSLIRVKANLYTRTNIIEHHADHVDMSWNHKTAIFYINSNNGFTVLENDTKIESIENRLLLFNGSKKHHSTSCTDSPVRININFNYL